LPVRLCCWYLSFYINIRGERLGFLHSSLIDTTVTRKLFRNNQNPQLSISAKFETDQDKPPTMSYLHLSHTRTRDLTPEYDRSLTHHHHPTKHISLSDNDDSDYGQDDYPYSSSHRPSRALITSNPPSQLERYNIWSDRHRSEYRPVDRDYEMEKSRMYRHTSHHHHDNDRLARLDPEESAFRMRFAATFSRPEHHHHHHHHHGHSDAAFRRKEKWVDERWETRERSRSRSRSRDGFWGDGGFWGDEKKDSGSEMEKWSRYRRVKGTRREEWRPLGEWRRV
jgi:hypothetical protein